MFLPTLYMSLSVFCKYSDVFGKPNEGVHKYKILNIAIVDLVATIVAAYFLSLITKYAFWKVTITLLLLSIPFHILFCVQTGLLTYLGINAKTFLPR